MDTMVTARMPQGKKEAGNSILRDLGTNPSQFINDIYDYVIQNRRLPLDSAPIAHSKLEIQEALAFVESIPLRTAGRFDSMDDEMIRQERLIAKGHAVESDFT